MQTFKFFSVDPPILVKFESFTLKLGKWKKCGHPHFRRSSTITQMISLAYEISILIVPSLGSSMLRTVHFHYFRQSKLVLTRYNIEMSFDLKYIRTLLTIDCYKVSSKLQVRQISQNSRLLSHQRAVHNLHQSPSILAFSN